MLIPIMPLAGLVPLMSVWIGAAFGVAAEPQPVVRRMVIQNELVIHVPIVHRPRPRIEWLERKGPKCLPVTMLAGATMSGRSSIDFVLRNRQRVRAKLDSDCKGLDFYGGFYVEPEDGRVCAKREEIRTQAGSSCRIERFRHLIPKVKH